MPRSYLRRQLPHSRPGSQPGESHGSHPGHHGAYQGHQSHHGSHQGHHGSHQGHQSHHGSHQGHHGSHQGHHNSHQGHYGSHQGHHGSHQGHHSAYHGNHGNHGNHPGLHPAARPGLRPGQHPGQRPGPRPKNLFIAGICGTFMAGIAQLARQVGHLVSGCDTNVYPPMSDILAQVSVSIEPGYDPAHLPTDPADSLILFGNVLSRGNPLVEAALNLHLPYQSGPAWLAKNILAKRRVVAVAGTHGKTTTAAMLNWILHQTGRQPGYLLGGKPGNLDASAALGSDVHFVIEADEYDTAFFDKRAKFIHYNPTLLVLTNLEFDHADIFQDLAQIQTQFNHLLRTVPANGNLIINRDDPNLQAVLDLGYWTPLTTYSLEERNSDWYAEATADDYSRFNINHSGRVAANVAWSHFGQHNAYNALAAIAAAEKCGIPPKLASQALSEFRATDRRLQLIYKNKQTLLYHDFAHHPTAIVATLSALKAHHPEHTLIAVVELASNTMKMGHHNNKIRAALELADHHEIYANPDAKPTPSPDLTTTTDATQLLDQILTHRTDNNVIVLMSNTNFDDIPSKLAQRLAEKGSD